jgi:4'-phosphopantetheinyl transferase
MIEGGHRFFSPMALNWQPAAALQNLPPLAPNDLHLWRIRTAAQGMNLADCWALLGDAQRQRAAAMRMTERRAHYVRAHAGLRLILARYLSVAPALKIPPDPPFSKGGDKSPPLAKGGWVDLSKSGGRGDFIYGINGKPALADAALQFNLTTSGELALVAISATAVGVDCELMRPQRRWRAIAQRMFAPEIVAALETAAETERLARFYQAWTALEAEVKCDGRGLFRARAADENPPQIAQFVPAAGYSAAVARATLPPVNEWLMFDL